MPGGFTLVPMANTNINMTAVQSNNMSTDANDTHLRTDDNDGSVSMVFEANVCPSPWLSSVRPS